MFLARPRPGTLMSFKQQPGSIEIDLSSLQLRVPRRWYHVDPHSKSVPKPWNGPRHSNISILFRPKHASRHTRPSTKMWGNKYPCSAPSRQRRSHQGNCIDIGNSAGLSLAAFFFFLCFNFKKTGVFLRGDPSSFFSTFTISHPKLHCRSQLRNAPPK